MEPLAIILAGTVTQAHALSAMPDAPVVPPPIPRPGRAVPARRATAAALYRLADRVAPRVTSAGEPATR
jgi:hypothetical protein